MGSYGLDRSKKYNEEKQQLTWSKVRLVADVRHAQLGKKATGNRTHSICHN